MPASVKKFNEAFDDAARHDKGLTDGHKEQLNELKKIVKALNDDGTFKAELTKWVGDTPGLSISRADDKDDSRAATFLISFGYDAFGGSPTIALSQKAARIPVGKPEGFLLPYDSDKLLDALGKAVAEQRASTTLASEALAYVRKGKAPTA